MKQGFSKGSHNEKIAIFSGYSKATVVMCITDKGGSYMQRKLLTNGNVFKRTDGRWCGVVWYSDEKGERKRKSFSGNTKTKVKDKITAYISLLFLSAESDIELVQDEFYSDLYVVKSEPKQEEVLEEQVG